MSLADARLLWRAANLAERHHADRCRLNRLGQAQRCWTCIALESTQQRMADQVTRVRMGRTSR
jgi:hypothetical protein